MCWLNLLGLMPLPRSGRRNSGYQRKTMCTLSSSLILNYRQQTDKLASTYAHFTLEPYASYNIDGNVNIMLYCYVIPRFSSFLSSRLMHLLKILASKLQKIEVFSRLASDQILVDEQALLLRCASSSIMNKEFEIQIICHDDHHYS